MELCRSISYSWAPYTELTKARIQFAVEDKEAAIRSMEHTLESVGRENIPGLAISYIALLTELLLRDGRAYKKLNSYPVQSINTKFDKMS